MKNHRSKQTSVLTLTIAAVGLILVLWPTAGQSQRSRRSDSERTETADPNVAAPPDSWASFDIILKRNIFSRNRRPARAVRAEVRATPPAPNPESYFVLKGVVQENDDFIAFIENMQTGTVQRLRRGDAVARGSIKSLTLDGLEFQMGDTMVVVEVGRDLEGGHGTLTTSQMLDLAAMPAPSTTGSSPSTTPAAPPSGDEADILKRLMEQRKQQLGQ